MPTIDSRFTWKGAFHVLSHDSPMRWFTISTNPIFWGHHSIGQKKFSVQSPQENTGPWISWFIWMKIWPNPISSYFWTMKWLPFHSLGGIQNPYPTPYGKGWDLCSLSSLIFLRGIEDCRLATKLHTLEALTIVDTLTFIYTSSFCSSCLKPPLLGYWLTIVIASIAHQQLWLQELLVLQGVPFEAMIWQGALICD